MKREIFKFLKSYSFGTEETNRIIVSSFLKENGLYNVKNQLIQSFIIKEGDTDYKQFIEFNEKYKICTIEELITAFEFVISPEEKVITGAVYTPRDIRDFIVRTSLNRPLPKDPTICDLACGCGGFLYTAAVVLKEELNISFKEIFERYIFGVDLMDYSVQRSKILLSLQAILAGEDRDNFNFNIFVGNSLDFDFKHYIRDFEGFYLVTGNPPYVCSRNIEHSSKKLLSNFEVCNSGHPDLYIPFFEIGINCLISGGKLGYITMNTFFKSLNGRALREYFSNKKYDLKILDFGSVQVFDSRSTYTCICFIEKQATNTIQYKKILDVKTLYASSIEKLSYDVLDNHNGWNFQSFDIISKIESTGIPFQNVFRTNTGIATLKNNVYIFDEIGSDADFYFLKDGHKIEKILCVDIINPNKFIRTDKAFSIKKKIIFPYEYVGKFPRVIPESRLKKLYPFAYRYLEEYKEVLSERDKGKGQYPEWYAYGRSQGLEKNRFKLLFPHISPIVPNYVLTNDENLLFYNGMGLISDDEEQLILAKKIMSSRLFWFYIKNTSKPYGSGYFSLSRNYLKAFGIYQFTEDQRNYLLNEDDKTKIDYFIEELYGVQLPISELHLS